MRNTVAGSAISEGVMKQRVISGVFVAIVTIASAYFGGLLLKGVLTFVGVWGSYEFIKIRKEKFNWILYVIMTTTVMTVFFFYSLSQAIMLLEIVILMSIAVFDENESFDDVCSTFLMSMMLGHATYFMSYVQSMNKWMFGYVLIAAMLTDTFAYFVGVKFGKHKLNSRISPNKTIEGSLGGWFFGALFSFIWAYLFRFFGMDMLIFIVASLLLPIVSQIGDLTFSLIKRHYGVKDFSNLIPGHGGILDRLDSNIFCIILFGALIILFA